MHLRHFLKTGLFLGALAALLSFWGCSSVSHTEPTPLRVAVAESLRPAMLEIAKAYNEKQPFVRVDVISGNALSLTRQMLQKVPADLTIIDSTALMDELVKNDIVVGKSRAVLLINALVCFAREDSPYKDFSAFADGKEKLAVGDLKETVLGQYTQQCFDNLKISNEVKNRLLQLKNSDAVVAAVLNAQAGAGIAYQSTAAVSRGIRVLGVFPMQSYGTISYEAAVLRAAPHYGEAWDFLSYLRGESAAEIFRRNGLTTPIKSNSPFLQ